ncbi:MAG: RloB family protein [Firmicutes bacterium]|nr:RloB family protein [Bacillota bacterium]
MRSYEKSEPKKNVFVPPQVKTEKVESFPVILIKDAGKNYRKEEGVVAPKTFFVIISGGEKRERNYFNAILNQDNFSRIKIEFVADPKLLNPDGLLETAKHKQAHYKTSQENEPDKMFIISDVDHFYNDLLRIKPKCRKLDIPLIISNSCFEVWLYYSKFSDQPTDFEISMEPLRISQCFKKYLGDKVVGGVNPRKAIFDIYANIQNAKTNYIEDGNGIPELFSTNMFVLAEELLPVIDKELKRMIVENEERSVEYKREH